MLNYQADGNYILISGSTYEVRDTIKSFGGRWRAEHKDWQVPASKINDLKAALARSSSASRTSSATRTTSAVRSGKCRVRGCHNMALRSGWCRTCEHDEL